MTVGEDFLSPHVRAECERIIPDIDGVKPMDAADTYLFLKANYQPQAFSGITMDTGKIV